MRSFAEVSRDIDRVARRRQELWRHLPLGPEELFECVRLGDELTLLFEERRTLEAGSQSLARKRARNAPYELDAIGHEQKALEPHAIIKCACGCGLHARRGGRHVPRRTCCD